MSAGSSLRFKWGGNSAELSTEDRRLSDALAVLFNPFLHNGSHDGERSSHRPTLTARVGETELSYPSYGDAVVSLEDVVAQGLLDGCEHLLLHAGAVTDGERTILVLGFSGAGKTTMTLELVKRGFRFMADEYTAIDASGAYVHPFPRSTIVKNIVRELPEGESLDVDSRWGRRLYLLPANHAPLEPHPIGELWLILPKYQPGAATTLGPVGTADVCARILPSTFNFEDNEEALWSALSNLSINAKGCDVEYGEVESGLDAAVRFLASQ